MTSTAGLVATAQQLGSTTQRLHLRTTEAIEEAHLMKYRNRHTTLMMRGGAIAIAMLCMAVPAARADEFIGYSFYASESLSVVLAKADLDTALANNNNDMNAPGVIAAKNKLSIAKANSAKATPFQLAVARNMPYVLLENMSTSASLEDFTLTINDPSQTFGVGQSLSLPPVNQIPTIASPSGTPDPSLNLTFQLASRLAPGEHVVIQVNLDPVDSSGNQFADYRDVFFKMNSSDMDGNATTSASFFDPVSNSDVILPEFQWENQD